MYQSEINRATMILKQRRVTMFGILFALTICGCGEPSTRQRHNPQPPSASLSTEPDDVVVFRAEVISVMPITQYAGELRPVSHDPRYAVTVCLLDNVEEFSCKQGETICLGLHSLARTFSSNDVVGRTFSFRIFGSARRYYHIEAESDYEGDRPGTGDG